MDQDAFNMLIVSLFLTMWMLLWMGAIERSRSWR